MTTDPRLEALDPQSLCGFFYDMARQFNWYYYAHGDRQPLFPMPPDVRITYD